jgi:hypothetical protein
VWQNQGIAFSDPLGEILQSKFKPALQDFVFLHELRKTSFAYSFKKQNHPDFCRDGLNLLC